MIARLRDGQDGQILPLLLVVLTSLLAVGMMLFQTGRASDLRAQAQTAADAAALAGAKDLRDQLEYLDGSLTGVNDASIEAAGAEYAQLNGAEVTSYERDGYDVRFTVRTTEVLGEDAEEVGSEGEPADARAQARVEIPLSFPFQGLGGLGAPVDGLAPALQEAAALAREFGLTVTSTTGGVHTSTSYHYSGLAIDVSNGVDTPEMAAFYNEAKERYGDQILELFYDPEGAVINGQPSSAIGGHSDHVHLALTPDAEPQAGGAESEDGDEAGGDEAGGGGDDGGDGGDGDDGGDQAAAAAPGCGSVPTTGGGSADAPSGGSGVPLDELPDPGSGPLSQGEIAQIIVAVGEDMGASETEILAAVEAGIVESGLQNVDYGDRDSLGVFQQRPSQGWGSRAEILDPEYAARQFFDRAMDTSGSTPGELAQNVQRSAFPERYDEVQGQALEVIELVRDGKLGEVGDVVGSAPSGVGCTVVTTEIKLVPYEGE